MRITPPFKFVMSCAESHVSESLVPSPLEMYNIPSDPKANSPPSWPIDRHSRITISDSKLHSPESRSTV